MAGSVEEYVKAFMRNAPQLVTVVTTNDGNEIYGMTVSSFTSVSLKPPLVMACISKDSDTHDPIIRAKKFAVNLLSHEQAPISERFAMKASSKEKFKDISYRMSDLKLPIIEGSLANMQCKLWDYYEAGDHTIFIGEVVDVNLIKEDLPLVYYKRGYTTIKRAT